MHATFKDTNLLNPETFKFEKKLFVKQELMNSEFKGSRLIAEISLLCETYNVKFSNRNFLYGLTNPELESIKFIVAKYVGASLFDITRTYGYEEAIKTILQYARDYGNFDIPRTLWDSEIKLPKTEYKETIINVLTFEDFLTELESIIRNSKNPDSRDLNYLQETKNLKSLECGIIPNRNTLKSLVENVESLKFKCHTTASLRAFIEVKQKLKTSDKSFIMQTLSNLQESEVLDDFATNRSFWKYVERNIIPTQKRFERFKQARELFKNLRDNNFRDSNNSKIENQELKLIDKFKQMRDLKSDNFAIRNITKLLKKYNPNSYQILALVTEINNSKVSLKQLLELFRAIDHSEIDKNYVKIKGKFWAYSRDRKEYGELFDLLKHSIQSKLKDLTKTYQKEINSDTQLAKEYKKLPEIQLPNGLLKGVAIPTSTDKFFEIDFSKHYITRGSRFELNRFVDPTKPYGVFVAWKAKNNLEEHMDIDLSCNLIKAENPEFDSDFTYRVCNFTRLDGDGLKHSGDWTSCREFNPINPVVVAELIRVEPSKAKGRLDFMINCFNGGSLKKYDVYVGLIDYDKVKQDSDSGRALINLEEAAFICKLGGDQNGFIKLFSIENNEILIEGSEISSDTYCSSASAVRTSIISTNYFKRFSSFDVFDLLQMIGLKESGVHNPYKLDLFLKTLINL